jgi:hypothetical protein
VYVCEIVDSRSGTGNPGKLSLVDTDGEESCLSHEIMCQV